jgi:hypothetical protein
MTPIPLGILALAGITGGGGAFDLLETTTLTTSASSVTFSGLDAYSDYKHLQIRAVVRGSTLIRVALQANFNGDTSGNYTLHLLSGNGSSVTSEGYTGLTYAEMGQFPGGGVADSWGANIVDILDFSSSTKKTTTRTQAGWHASSDPRTQLESALWNDTSAVTSIALTPGAGQFVAGTRISMIGIR